MYYVAVNDLTEHTVYGSSVNHINSSTCFESSHFSRNQIDCVMCDVHMCWLCVCVCVCLIAYLFAYKAVFKMIRATLGTFKTEPCGKLYHIITINQAWILIRRTLSINTQRNCLIWTALFCLLVSFNEIKKNKMHWNTMNVVANGKNISNKQWIVC